MALLSVAVLDLANNNVGASEEPKGVVKERKSWGSTIGVGVKGAFLWKFDDEQNPVDSIWYPTLLYISFSPTLSILGFPVSEIGIGSNWRSEQKYHQWSVYVAAKSSVPSYVRAFNPYVGFSLYYANYPPRPPHYSIFPSLLHIIVGTEVSLGSHFNVTSEVRCMPQTLIGISKTVAIYVGLTGYILW